jgi:hypothetical protein
MRPSVVPQYCKKKKCFWGWRCGSHDHDYNPSYLGGGDLGGCQLEASLPDSISPNKKVGVVAHACHPSYTGYINRRIVVKAGLA